MNDVLKLPQALANEPAITGAIGKVASPPRHESTSEEFYFWVAENTLVEKSQIVRVECEVAEKNLKFYGLIREVYRQSRQSNLGEEYDRHDGDINYEPPFDAPGFTYAAVTILRTEPPVMAPPTEGSPVFLGGEHDADMAYAADEIEKPLAVGRVRNGGGDNFAGPGRIDLDYLLGANGGHLNVNGVAGRGTKSSLLLHFNYLLLREARRQKLEKPSGSDRLRIVPIIFNVKNSDLFHIDRRSKNYNPAKHLADWQALGIDDPAPFSNVTFYAPQKVDSEQPIDTGRRTKPDVKAYSWSLRDVIERGLFAYLFAEEDKHDANFGALALAIELWLTRMEVKRDNTRHRILITDADHPNCFQKLLDFVSEVASQQRGSPWGPSHHSATIRKLHRRLFRLVYESSGVLPREKLQGKPLDVRSLDSCDPIVIDLNGLSAVPELQRFVVAAIFDQLVAERTGSHAQSGLIYLVTLDELNRFARSGSHDPITELIERVAAEMRSQGIILLGAQQQASLVSGRVIENAGIRALGKSGSLELSHKVWGGLSESARKKASILLKEEKLLIQDSFREPMLVKIPFPPWALRKEEVEHDFPATDTATEFDDP